MRRVLGIDFSGNHLMWRPRRRNTNVWISDVRYDAERSTLVNLSPVQRLPGGGHPFDRLIALLRDEDFEAAAIDAPFSVPHNFVHPDHPGLLKRIGLMENPVGRPFPSAREFVNAVSGVYPPLNRPKPLRVTEEHWKGLGLNVRSTLWSRYRGGAEMTVACMKLLHEVQRPIWPWVGIGGGLIVEAFPMAQLKHWQLPHQGYGWQTERGRAKRAQILGGIKARRFDLGKFERHLESNSDALDAVVCAFSAIAVLTGKVAVPPSESAWLEGWISVHT